MSIFSKFRRAQKHTASFPATYIVVVHVEHPNMSGHVHSFPITIDAHDKAHALERLRKELTFKFDRPKKL